MILENLIWLKKNIFYFFKRFKNIRCNNPKIRIVSESAEDQFTEEELIAMAAKGCQLSKIALQELEEERAEKAKAAELEEGIRKYKEWEKVQAAANSGCPHAKKQMANWGKNKKGKK